MAAKVVETLTGHVNSSPLLIAGRALIGSVISTPAMRACEHALDGQRHRISQRGNGVRLPGASERGPRNCGPARSQGR